MVPLFVSAYVPKGLGRLRISMFVLMRCHFQSPTSSVGAFLLASIGDPITIERRFRWITFLIKPWMQLWLTCRSARKVYRYPHVFRFGISVIQARVPRASALVHLILLVCVHGEGGRAPSCWCLIIRNEKEFPGLGSEPFCSPGEKINEHW